MSFAKGKQIVRAVSLSITPPKDNYMLDREEDLEEEDSNNKKTLINAKVKEMRRQIRI